MSSNLKVYYAVRITCRQRRKDKDTECSRAPNSNNKNGTERTESNERRREKKHQERQKDNKNNNNNKNSTPKEHELNMHIVQCIHILWCDK